MDRPVSRGFLFSHFRVLSSILSLSFLCFSVSEALFTLSFSFLSERFLFRHDKAALGQSLPPKNEYRLLHAFECNMNIISRVNGEVISRGEAECNLAIS